MIGALIGLVVETVEAYVLFDTGLRLRCLAGSTSVL
jgi:hypothetical protein